MKYFFCAAFAFFLFVNGFTPFTFAYMPRPGEVLFCVPSPDGKRLATAQYGESDRFGKEMPIRIWDVDSGKESHRFDQYTAVNFVAFFPDGKKILIAGRKNDSDESSMVVLDIDSGKVLQTFKDAPWYYFANEYMLFSSDGKKIVVLNSTTQVPVGIWAAESGERQQKLGKSDRFVHSRNLAPDGKRFITAYSGVGKTPVPADDESAIVADLESKKELLLLRGDTRIDRGAFSPDGKKIVTCGAEKIRIWDADSGKHLQTLKSDTVDRNSGISSVFFLPDGKKIATIGYRSPNSGLIRIWDTESERELFKFKPCQHFGMQPCALHIVFLPDGKRMMTACKDDIHIWNVDSGKELHKVVLQALYRKKD